MSDRRFGAILSLARQGLTVGLEFGPHSLEALLGIAEVVEESVYEPRSLVRTDSGIAFALANPPLRTGGFSQLRIRVNGTDVPPEAIHLRTRSAPEWRAAASVTAAAPLELEAGTRTEFRADGTWAAPSDELTVRLELRSVAIPPLVWFEFTDRPTARRSE